MISRKLKDLRSEQGITQTELSSSLNVSQSTIGMWESGKRSPDLRTAKQVADYFGVTVDYLFGLDYDIRSIDKSKSRGKDTSLTEGNDSVAEEGGKTAASDSLPIAPTENNAAELDLLEAVSRLDANGIKKVSKLIKELLTNSSGEGGAV